MATQHGFFGVGLFATATRPDGRFQVPSKAENSILSFLAPVFRNFTPLEFPHGTLERQWPLRRFCSGSVVLKDLRDGSSFPGGLVSCVSFPHFTGDHFSLLPLGISRFIWL